MASLSTMQNGSKCTIDVGCATRRALRAHIIEKGSVLNEKGSVLPEFIVGARCGGAGGI